MADFVAVQRVAHVEELDALLGGDGAHAVHDVRRGDVLCPVEVGVVEGAAAGPPTIAAGVADVCGGGNRRRVAGDDEASTATGCSPRRPSPRESRRWTCAGRPVLPAGARSYAWPAQRRCTGPSPRIQLTVQLITWSANPTVVRRDREHNELHVLLLSDREQLVGLRRFALEGLSALGSAPDVDRTRAGAGDVDLLLYRYTGGALDRRHVRAVAAVVGVAP